MYIYIYICLCIYIYAIHVFVVIKKHWPKQSKPEDKIIHNQYRLKCLKHYCLNNFVKQLSTISTINHICVNHMHMVLEDNGNDIILKCGWEIQLGSRNNLNNHIIYSIEKLSQNIGATAATDKWKQNYMSDGYQHEKSLGQFDFKWLTKTASQIAETNITKQWPKNDKHMTDKRKETNTNSRCIVTFCCLENSFVKLARQIKWHLGELHQNDQKNKQITNCPPNDKKNTHSHKKWTNMPKNITNNYAHKEFVFILKPTMMCGHEGLKR